MLSPVSVTNMGGGKYMADLGKVYSGVPSILFSGGTAGTTVNMLGGFALLASGDIDPSQNQSTTLSYYAVLNGSKFTFQPAEYNTMRYFEINNSPMPVTAANFRFVERNSQMNDASSSFTSPNATLNAVWDMMKHTLPVDAQEEFIDSMRQKGGFLGDGYQESLAAMQVEDERVLTRSRLNEFVESMGEFWNKGADIGRVNACYPDNSNARDIPDYTQMYLDWVWEYYLQSGDLAFLKTNYTALTNIAQYVNRSLNPANGLITRLYGGTSGSYTNGIIDWPPNMQFGYDLNTVRGPGNASHRHQRLGLGRLRHRLAHRQRGWQHGGQRHLPRDGQRPASRDKHQPDQRRRCLCGRPRTQRDAERARLAARQRLSALAQHRAGGAAGERHRAG